MIGPIENNNPDNNSSLITPQGCWFGSIIEMGPSAKSRPRVQILDPKVRRGLDPRFDLELSLVLRNQGDQILTNSVIFILSESVIFCMPLFGP